MRRGGVQGGALFLVLVVILLVQGLVALTFLAAAERARASSDARWSIEGRLVAASALALGRVHFATGGVLPEGTPQLYTGSRPDGWGWRVTATRRADLVWLEAVAERVGPSGSAISGGRATLLLQRLPSDTLQRIPSRGRF